MQVIIIAIGIVPLLKEFQCLDYGTENCTVASLQISFP